jgi:uncharacterized small protein (DUF1192 family)
MVQFTTSVYDEFQKCKVCGAHASEFHADGCEVGELRKAYAALHARISKLEAAVAKAKDALEPHYTFANNNTGIMVAYNVLAEAARAAQQPPAQG